MRVQVSLDSQGFIPDGYAKFAPESARMAGMPVINFPVQITGIPKKTKTLAVALIDYDAVPVGGFPWIHWLAANLPVTDITANLAATTTVYTRGTNSMWRECKDQPELTQAYIGPMPPDKVHDYSLTIFAVDQVLPLQNGFFLNDLRRALRDHVIEEVSVDLPARSE
ncbi:YbhB/YbcL family Raf kinase inhibitor-like protein [Weissella diestrammenae]|uniref:YbhB/YbcL family Raf kinase inhibitor-like protein n=1 Tax=Weissella diestrammenae TaxID=1162633 RepID=A0A7G9T7C7_9LACO|nr:YbhB/YbcL family Raf kinase inhibitor-like protein [Weissella diestrammenae]MCM0582015.1 YbhB/YbcL family Raf kinase inhibitor-like protein [Weissella diestrammenae]QNN76002.1 YbhB/YbcL family Raf kinase inhibitor-like protein [Weissella diestrammenae]